MYTLILVGLGGALGSIARYSTGQLITFFTSTVLPLPTLIVNIIGSLLIGLGAGTPSIAQSPHLSPLLMIGFLGGFTTFSTFSLESITLL